MSQEEEILNVEESDETFRFWTEQVFLSDEVKAAINGSAVLITPTLGFGSSDLPNFPVGTDDVFTFLKEHLPQEFPVEICIDDEDFNFLALHSDYKRIGKFLVKKVAVPAFLIVLTAYVTKVMSQQDDKPQVIINNINNVPAPPVRDTVLVTPTAPTPHNHINPGNRPHKYLDRSKVTFTVTVEDTTGKSKSFHYEGPVSAVGKVTSEIKKAFIDEPEETGN